MHAGGMKQVESADDVGDALPGIVYHDGEMITGRRVLAGEDHVTPRRRIGGDLSGRAIAGF